MSARSAAHTWYAAPRALGACYFVYASLFNGGSSEMGETLPEQSAVHLVLEMRGGWFNARMGRYFALPDCAGVQGSPFWTLRPTLTSDPSCRLILSSAISPSIPLRPRPYTAPAIKKRGIHKLACT